MGFNSAFKGLRKIKIKNTEELNPNRTLNVYNVKLMRFRLTIVAAKKQ
jgi:hypothetical protein